MLALLFQRAKPFYWRSYVDQTLLHPLGATALVVLGILTFTLPRRKAILPLLLMACFVSSAQRISLAGLDLTLLRLIIFFGLIRLFMRGEWRDIRLCTPDKLLIGWAIVQATAYVLLHKQFGSIIYMSARMFEGLGSYFLVRGLVREWRDVQAIGLYLLVISVPIAAAFLVESQTRHNLFAVFGGVPKITQVREGRLRCTGAFNNPILAGVFWAALMPLVAARYWSPHLGKGAAMLGVSCCLVVIVTCASSTPLGGVAAAILAAFLFKVRHLMREIRWGIVITLTVLHMVMKAPVWHLISRVDLVGGSTGWHRYNLINEFIRNTRDWFLIGVTSTGQWGVQLFDLTNQFVLEAVYGGFGAMMLFILVLAAGYRGVGKLWRTSVGDPERTAVYWALGCCLFVHTACFFAVSYFGQVIVSWFLVIGSVASLAEPLWLGQASTEPERAAETAPGAASTPAVPRRRLSLRDEPV